MERLEDNERLYFEFLLQRAGDRKIIALDYDGTITTNFPFWLQFIRSAVEAGYFVVIVTMRAPHEVRSMHPSVLEACEWIVPTSRAAKLKYCQDRGLNPSIWVDDMPMALFTDFA